ncbi:MAG: glycoside hydrolase family 97 protein [Bacteroidales bacterium]
MKAPITLPAISKVALLTALFLLQGLNLAAQEFLLQSPGGDLSVEVTVDESISYSVRYKGKHLLGSSWISMDVSIGGDQAGPFILKDSKQEWVRDEIRPLIRLKREVIPDHYNAMQFTFQNGFELQFRAYDDGITYRFAFPGPGELVVNGEIAEFNLPGDASVIYSCVKERPGADWFHTSFEETYKISRLDSLDWAMMAITPVLIRQDELPTLLITDSDIWEYPGMFLKKGEGSTLRGVFAPYPLKDSVVGEEFRLKQVVERAPYIARSGGERSFPWRVIAVAPEDSDLLLNDLVYRLASPPASGDFGWVRPGISTEEWITASNLYGVDFVAGINTATYLYYIDFASRFGFEYVMLDAGWSDVNDLFAITPEMDMEKITSYAREKGIGLILWTQALTMERQMEQAMMQFKAWNIAVVMTDFIDRDDQLAIRFMHQFAAECAKNGFMCMIHGAPKPAGFSRTWPNMLTREGVLGSEYNIWSASANPDHDLILPFVRMPSGPMDYEPGIMQHATREQNAKMGFEKVIAQGTRMHQMAMFVIYESPLQLFSGNISDALREPELMTFLGKVPTTWDQTIILKASLGEYIVEARRQGEIWYIAALNNWEAMEFHLPMDFLPEGPYRIEEARDGINAARNPHDYSLTNKSIRAPGSLKIKLAPGGGYLARIMRDSGSQ